MKRDIGQLAEREFDLLIIGGGIYGVMAAWDAAERGLSVAVIDKGDFAGATSSNSLKIVHGGLRYIQHADIKRMRESIRERRMMMKLAPHLVHPLAFVIPTYGHFIKGPEAMFIALKINDLVSFDRNSLPDPQKHLPAGKIISKQECLQMIPGVDAENLTGGAIWYDAQLYNSERFIFSVLRSATDAGAVAVNYAEAVALLTQDKRVTGVRIHDRLSGNTFTVRSKIILNTTGPWLNRALRTLLPNLNHPPIALAKMMNLVTTQLFDAYSVGFYSKYEYKDKDAVISKGSRLYFVTPWRGLSMVGTAQTAYEGDPEDFTITRDDIQQFMNEINEAYPPANLSFDTVLYYYGGLLPIEPNYSDPRNVTLLKHYRLIDHQKEHGIQGLLSVMSVKYTTARDVTEKALNLAVQKLGQPERRTTLPERYIHGGDIPFFNDFLKAVQRERPLGLSESVLNHLAYNYGTAYREILAVAEQNPRLAKPLTGHPTILRAEVVYGIREEMAQHLDDIVFRRTELGPEGHPSDETLEDVAQLAAQELGWNPDQTAREIEAVKAIYEPVIGKKPQNQPQKTVLEGGN